MAHWQYPYSEQTGASAGHPALEPEQQAPWPVPHTEGRDIGYIIHYKD